MNTDSINIEKDLDIIIAEKTGCGYSVAAKWKWRVLHEYPDDLKDLVLQWAKDAQLPKAGYCELTIDNILQYTDLGFMDAVDLLYILSKDPAGGGYIYAHSLRRDLHRGR